MSAIPAAPVPSVHISITLAPSAFPAPWIAVSRYDKGEWEARVCANETPPITLTLRTPTRLSKPYLMVPKYNFGSLGKFVPLFLLCEAREDVSVPIDAYPLFCAAPVDPKAFAYHVAQHWRSPKDLRPWFVTPSLEESDDKALNTNVSFFTVPIASDENPDDEVSVSVLDVWNIAPLPWKQIVAYRIERLAFMFTVKQWEELHAGDLRKLAAASCNFMHPEVHTRFEQFLAGRQRA